MYINVGLFVFKILRNINFDIIAKIGCMCTTVNMQLNNKKTCNILRRMHFVIVNKFQYEGDACNDMYFI